MFSRTYLYVALHTWLAIGFISCLNEAEPSPPFLNKSQSSCDQEGENSWRIRKAENTVEDATRYREFLQNISNSPLNKEEREACPKFKFFLQYSPQSIAAMSKLKISQKLKMHDMYVVEKDDRFLGSAQIHTINGHNLRLATPRPDILCMDGEEREIVSEYTPSGKTISNFCVLEQRRGVGSRMLEHIVQNTPGDISLGALPQAESFYSRCNPRCVFEDNHYEHLFFVFLDEHKSNFHCGD